MVIPVAAEALRPAPTETATTVAPEDRPVLREATVVRGMQALAGQAVRAEPRIPATVERAGMEPNGAPRMVPVVAVVAVVRILPEVMAERLVITAVEADPRAMLPRRLRTVPKASSSSRTLHCRHFTRRTLRRTQTSPTHFRHSKPCSM